MQKIAIIDLGTNTFHLMIAEVKDGLHHVLLRERTAVKIGLGGINNGIITQEGLERAVVAMKKFRKIIDEYSITNIHAFGTSALRNARNVGEVVQRLEDETGIKVKIISGDEEAELIYKGVRAAVRMEHQVSLIADIGGGSVEFIIADATKVFWKQSFEIGAQRLLEKFQKHDPILETEVKAIDDYLREQLRPLMIAVAQFNPEVLVGSSGTFDTLSEMHSLHNMLPYSEQDPETPLTAESFYRSFNELKQKNRAERMRMPGMIEMRVDMIVVACCLIDFLLKNHSFSAIRVSTYSLKEGVLAEYH